MNEDIGKSLKGVTVTQFLLYLQNLDIWPCELQIGDEARPLTAQEVLELKDNFKKL